MLRTKMARSAALALTVGACTSPTLPEAPHGASGAEVPAHGATVAMNGRCVKTHDEGSTTFTYEEGRMVVSSQEASDTRTTYTYEGARLTRVARTMRGEFAFTKDLTYDASGRLLLVITRTTERATAHMRRTFEYDAQGRLSRWVESARDDDDEEVVTAVCAYQYDSAGRLVDETRSAPGAPDEPPSISRYRYDAQSKLAQLTTDYLVLRYRYGESGLLAEIEVASDASEAITEVYAYDDAGRMVSRTNREADSVRVVRFTYDGSFGFGAQCGGPLPSPPGIPPVPGLGWLGISL